MKESCEFQQAQEATMKNNLSFVIFEEYSCVSSTRSDLDRGWKLSDAMVSTCNSEKL